MTSSVAGKIEKMEAVEKNDVPHTSPRLVGNYKLENYTSEGFVNTIIV